MKKIKLNSLRKTKYSKLNLFALVDDKYFEYLNKWNWFAKPQGNTFYEKRTDKKTNRAIQIHG